MPYIIALLVFLLVISIVFARGKRPYIEENHMRNISTDELGRIAIDACKRMRIDERGGGIDPAGLMHSIRRANNMLEQKIKNSEPLSEGEKWFYENYYLVYRYAYARKDNLKLLPHVNGIPRIVAIAKIIVNNSLDGLDGERVRAVCDYIKATVSLTYAELREFNNAINYAILEQIYILSKRIIKQEFYKKMAYKHGFCEKYLKSDVYVYYIYHINTLSSDEKIKLSKGGFDEKSALLNFNHITLHNALMAKTLFAGLRESDDFLPVHIGLKYLGAYQTLNKHNELENVASETRLAYFSELEKICTRISIDESYAAEKLIEMAEHNALDVSEILFDNKRALKKYLKTGKIQKIRSVEYIAEQRVYVTAILAMAVLSTTLTAVFLDVICGILAFIPFLFISENILNYLLMHTVSVRNTPKMCYKSVPYNHSVMVVVSEFITSLQQFKGSLEHLRVINAANGGENIRTALLVDIKGGDAPLSDLDREIVEFLSAEKLEEGINIFIRKKEQINGKYQGKERKRGAINALNKLLITHNEEEFCYIYDNSYVTPEYVVALDADNTLLPAEILEMVNMMAHPYNRRFDLLACHSKYDLYSLKNKYSVRFLSESGIETYPTYSGLYYRLFRRDIYCGKGIYRLKAFYNELEGVFPSGKILSHDIIEGSVLRTGGGTTVFEDAPESFLSDRERRKRWQRGDIQLLPFISGRWRNDEGKVFKTRIEPIYKFIMAKNIIGNLKELCVFTVLLLGLFLNINLLWFGLVLFGAPYVINEIKILRGIASGVLPRYILKKTVKNILLMTEDFFTLSYYALSNALVLLTTLFRMATGRRLLEWKTYYHSQNSMTLSSYMREFAPFFAVWTAIAVGLSVFRFNAVFFGMYMLGAVVAYAELYIMSKITLNCQKISQENRDILLKYADKTYNYFKFMMYDKFIIPDNLQLKPYKGASKTTSPTNIGFSMLAQICAYKLGLIGLEECIFTLNKILDEIRKLPKWHGNLYNWYDVDTLEPVNKFVSSVDSGNFLAGLMIVKEFFRENNEEIGELKAELTITNTDLKALFDENKNLFYLGYDGEKYVGHYDLLNSESRILTTIFIALSGNTEHFFSLQRDFSSYRGNTLLSWSGTMFETMMPDLFFSAPKFSLFDNTIRNTLIAQMSAKHKGVWGISESGYYGFDEELKYQYYAFGLDRLALRNEKNKAVIAPYAGALAMGYFPEQAIENLRKIEEMGGLREYGFYESIDCEARARFVSSFMSHHQGMILCAITNYLCENELKRLLKNNINIKGILNIYNELTPESAFGIKSSEKRNKMAYKEGYYYKNNIKIEQYFHAIALTDAQYSTVINGYGCGFSKNNDILLSRDYGIYEENNGAFFFLKSDEKWLSPTYLPQCKNAAFYTMEYSSDEIIHINNRHGISQRVTLLNGLNGEVRKLLSKEKGSDVAFYMPIALNTKDGYLSHPAFNGLFVEAKAQNNILILKKRGMNANDKERILALRVEGVADLRWEANDLNFIGRGNTLSNAAMLNNRYEKNAPSLGDVLHPCAAFMGNMTGDSCQIAFVYGEDEQKTLDTLKALPDDMYSYAILTASGYTVSSHTNDLLGELLYLPYPQTLLNSVINSGKRDKFLVKTGGKKVLAYHFNESNPEKMNDFLTVAKDLNVLRVDIKYVVAIKPPLRQNLVDYIGTRLRNYRVTDYEIVEEGAEILDFAFISLNFDMSFTHTKLFNSRVFDLKSAEKENSGETVDHGADLYPSGSGGFDENDAYIVTERPALPYSNVICDINGGMVTTEGGGGFFYFGNSRENKASRFDNDCVGDIGSEFLYAMTSDGAHNLCKVDGNNRFSVIERGKTTYVCRQNRLTTAVGKYMICEGRARIIAVDISAETNAEIVYGFFPALNWVYAPDFITFEQKNDIITVTNLKNNQVLYVKAVVENGDNLAMLNGRQYVPYFEYEVEKEHEKIYFVFTQDAGLIMSLNAVNIPVYEEKSLADFKNLGNIEVASPIRSFNILTRFLPYQIASSRLRGKTGYYQVGGATGFRDQLQDSAAFLHADSESVRRQILYAAQHQYEEGDVMHWWHHPNYGLRSRITDDKLFLPLLTAEYLNYTGDMSILNVEIPYLKSPILLPTEFTRFENPPVGDIKEPLIKHCIKAIKSALRYGEHGLPIMGSGDWNDGMDKVCALGRGESVFNAMLCYEVLIKLSVFCAENTKNELLRIANELKTAVNTFAFEGDRYKRLFTDDGRWLGSANSKELTLDLLVQSYAVISGIADDTRGNIVLNTAKKLIDHDAGIIKLLEPPLDKNSDLGYISAYPKGVRENGGQYTHAAMWYLIALTKLGRQDEAYELFQMLNPVQKCRNSAKNAQYRGEPYVMSGDVYSNADNYGRMGWSWYTGSAAWAYRLIVEGFFGLRRNGNKLLIEPKLPQKLDRTVLTYRYGDSVYLIEYRIGEQAVVTVDGEEQKEIALRHGIRERVVVEAPRCNIDLTRQ